MFFSYRLAPTISSLSLIRRPTTLFNASQSRTKVLLASSHPFEYFKSDYDPSKARFTVHHPTPVSADAPLYFKITLNRSLIGLPWQKRYVAGVLFKHYAPHKCVRPKALKLRISTNTTIYREATPETAEMILQLKEVLQVENIWNENEYRQSAAPLLGKFGKTLEELQQHRGYYLVGNLIQQQQPTTSVVMSSSIIKEESK
jgi:ribosomal protein L30/L7E